FGICRRRLCRTAPQQHRDPCTEGTMMVMTQEQQYAPGAGRLDWLMASFARQVPDVAHAITVSGDGLRLACSADLPVDQADHLAAVISGLASLTTGAARVMTAGTVRQTIVDMDGGVMLVM